MVVGGNAARWESPASVPDTGTMTGRGQNDVTPGAGITGRRALLLVVVTVLRSRRPARILVVAAAGYGKSTALDVELPPAARRLAASEAVTTDLAGARWWGLDDLDRLSVEEQTALARRLAALPPEVGVVLTSRRPVPSAMKERLRGTVLQRSAGDLALDELAVMRLLRDEYHLTDPELAAPLCRLTAGWPALVHLVADAVACHGGDLADAAGPTSPAATWVVTELLTDLEPGVLRWLGTVASLGPVVPSLVHRLDAAGVPPVAVRDLHRLGLLVGSPDRPGLRLVPVLAQVLRARSQPAPPALLLEAGAAYEEAGLWYDAVAAAHRAGEPEVVRRLLAVHGEQMLAAGHAVELLDLLGERPGGAHGAQAPEDTVTVLLAEAQRRTGSPAAATRTLAPLTAQAELTGWSASLAVRMGWIAFMRGDLTGTLSVLGRVAGRPPDVAWLALRAQALAGLGRREEAGSAATAALVLAEELDDDASRAEAHLALARVGTATGKETHLETAAAAAAAAGDLVSLARARTNELHLLLAQARYAEAAALAPEAVRLVELVAPPGMRASVLHNAAEAVARTGEYEAAEWYLGRCLALGRRLGPARTATALLGLGDLHREVGRVEPARDAYREAVALSRVSGEVQVLVPALAGLARVEAPRHPELAAELTQEALAVATPPVRAAAELAAGWSAWHRGEHEAARGHAGAAVAGARHHDTWDLLADSLELLATCSAQPDWDEARRLWAEGGAVPAVARVLVAAGSGPDAPPDARAPARESARLLRRLGVAQVHDRPLTEDWDTREVRVAILGGFDVLVAGRPVPWKAWRSKQARNLVKLVAAHRGRPVTRGALCEELWPGDDPARTGHRLSVLLATVRGVLDPGRVQPADQYVAADQTGVWLDLRHVSVDADDLIRDAAAAARLHARGEVIRAADLLAEVDRCYRGDAFEDDPYQDWALPLREEARAAWLDAAGTLATLRCEEGRVGEAQRLLLRVLLADPYDERAHGLLVRALAAAGRHGEARRALARWQQAMRSLGAPAPDPVRLGVLVPPEAPQLAVVIPV